MTEKTEESRPTTPPDYSGSRRQFLRKGALVGLATLSGIGVKKELEKIKAGVETDSGIFIPLYEAHTVGISEKDIPEDTDILFREGVSSSESTASVLKETKKDQSSLLSYCARNRIRIAIGDVAFPAISLLVGSLESTIGAYGLLKKRTQEKKSPLRKTRREFLKTATSVWFSTKLIVDLATTLIAIAEKKQTALKRIIVRLDGLRSHFDPENAIVFFRNALLSLKLLAIAENLKDKKGEKPKIAFQVGAGHGGIEDFLILGADFCRRIILSHPQAFLQEVVKINYDSFNVCATRIIHLPENYSTEQDPDGVDLEKTVSSDLIVDSLLMKQINMKLERN